MNIGDRRHHGMNKLSLAVHANVRPDAEVPPVNLAGLVHLRTALILLVLDGTRRADYTAPTMVEWADQPETALRSACNDWVI